ncbi:hypothetical protein PPL_02918 [Heterostelium album PN500]|uniref:RING-type domain-containing protein n=1 Tax=Heterostelium pallidum (strain ATCC 26659 / Pp 5 / PN500) TaxID=670386 RepID=D3B3F0_HETP5|nr:hypothetical protein PPL_02918 [Heterostelium album PN500]EFA83848.1 hypothetical protein PPL_02918 [Heterostelium album PN500]|eukprot:XP_020435965.1 hypothetical protein PPL_02918 [Heterostelium album PN500]
MEFDDDPEINLSIPVINIKSCLMTPCGHNFCERCILECINRNHKCPCCNAPATKDKLIKNHQLEKIISIIEFEKEESSKRYFNNLIYNNNQQQQVVQQSNAKKPILHPVQELFSKYLKTSLLAYEDFYNQLAQKLEENKKILEKERLESIKKYENQVVMLDQVKEEFAYKQDKLVKSHQNTLDLFLKSFEDHLKKTAVAPNFVNIQVSIVISSKNITFEHISLKPSTTIIDIKQLIIDRFNQKGGESAFIKYMDDARLVAQLPIASGGKEIALDEDIKPLSLYEIVHGSKIILKGDIQLYEDLPKQCFAATYKPGDTMDYFKCLDCNYSWICKQCSNHCHKGHKTIPYLVNHKASFACCYDTKNKCILSNK